MRVRHVAQFCFSSESVNGSERAEKRRETNARRIAFNISVDVTAIMDRKVETPGSVTSALR